MVVRATAAAAAAAATDGGPMTGAAGAALGGFDIFIAPLGVEDTFACRRVLFRKLGVETSECGSVAQIVDSET